MPLERGIALLIRRRPQGIVIFILTKNRLGCVIVPSLLWLYCWKLIQCMHWVNSQQYNQNLVYLCCISKFVCAKPTVSLIDQSCTATLNNVRSVFIYLPHSTV